MSRDTTFDEYEFSFLWQTCPDAVALQRQMTRLEGRQVQLTEVFARAQYLRKRGVNLKNRQNAGEGPANLVDGGLWQGLVSQCFQKCDITIALCGGVRLNNSPTLVMPPANPASPDGEWGRSVAFLIGCYLEYDCDVMVVCATGFLGKLVCGLYLMKTYRLTIDETVDWIGRLGKLPPHYTRRLRGMSSQ